VWAPVSYVASSDTNQPQGYFFVSSVFGTSGDTGGPVFQNSFSVSGDAGVDAGSVDGGRFSLPMTLLGLVSNIGPCQGDPCIHENMVVSVTQPDNYVWLTSLGGSPVPAAASFGAAN
jgi:hypothetical protein